MQERRIGLSSAALAAARVIVHLELALRQARAWISGFPRSSSCPGYASGLVPSSGPYSGWGPYIIIYSESVP